VAGTAGAQPCFDLATSHTDGRVIAALRALIESDPIPPGVSVETVP